MHLSFLTSEYPHNRTGPAAGIGTSIKNIVIALVKKKVKVSVFIYGQTEDDIFTEEGIKFHLIRHRKFKLFGWYWHRKFLQNYLNKFIVIDKIDTVEAPDWTGIAAFMKLRCPLVVRFHGSDAYFCKLENRIQRKRNYWFEKTAIQKANYLVSVSEFTAEETRKIFKLKKEIKIIPNSVDISCFIPQHKTILSESILYFGSLISKKGVLELAQIFNIIVEQMPDVLLRIAGRDVVDISTGKSTKELMKKHFTHSAAKKVEWLGYLPYEKILEEIRKAQIVVLPSFAEALPMTWIEAMAMEKALVTSNIGWSKEVMIDGKTGFMVNPRDHHCYAERIIQLMKDTALAKQMGKAAKERVLEKFSTEVVVDQNINFYKKIIKKQL